MRFTSRAAVAALFVSSAMLVVGCSGAAHDFPPSPVNAILTGREAVRLAELHLNDIDPQANPRDVVSIEPTGDATLVAFNTFYDETHVPPKQSRLVRVEHDGTTREVTFSD